MSFPERVFFITSVTWRRTPHFQTDRAASLLVNTLYRYRSQDVFDLYEFVVMPDHIHLLLAPNHSISLEKALQFIKGGYSFQYKRETGSSKEIWERSFTNHHIRDWQDFENHCRYIRQNPVRAGLCSKPEDCRYSSAGQGYELDLLQPRLKPAFRKRSSSG